VKCKAHPFFSARFGCGFGFAHSLFAVGCSRWFIEKTEMTPGHTVLPFTKLTWPKFEAFCFETLSCGLRVKLPATERPRRSGRTYHVVRADPYGGEGHNQRGIDFYCTMDDGSEWVFQAKLMPKFGLTEAKAVVKKARRNFPKAKRYILLVSGIPNPTAIDYIRKQSTWEIWGGPSITSHFLHGTPIQRQIEIIGRVWPSLATQLVSEYYPLRDSLLVTSDEFFAIWLKPDRLFHHRSTLVGYTDILSQLSAFLCDPVQRAAILVAPGGRGKSRLLRAFSERVVTQHSDFTIRFVDPLAPHTAQAHSLRAAGDTRFIVVQDDAHRSETLRHDLIACLAATQGKLLLATRPQALASLEELVIRLGIPSNQLRAPIQLPKLKLHDYEALAIAELDSKHRRHARFLARMGRDCPLVITVGASLINRNLIPPDKFEEENFRNEVFARFEGDELNRLGQTHPRQLVREVLQTIAVFSPWLEQEVDAKTVAGFVGCSEADLRAVLTSLEAGQLVVQSGRGRRVVPDLFSDHLVYSACYSDDGRLTPYAQRLAGAFATSASQNMLRNLAEADWRAKQYHATKVPASLLDPFWQSLWNQFTVSDFMTRARIVEKWGSHSVYQPVRSLELCELAFHLRDAPPPPNSPWLRGETRARINSHQHVLDHVPAVLEPIAIFHDDHRERCLDLLLNLADIWPRHKQLNDNNHPWAVIGRIASYKEDHPISASLGVLAWIEKHLGDPRFKQSLTEPNGILETILSPVFAREFDASYSEGNTFHFRHPPVRIDQTQPMRDHALKIIEQQILPAGEVATLNVFPVLVAASQVFNVTMGRKFDKGNKRRWQPERLKALAILDRIANSATGPIRWKIRTHMRHLVRAENSRSMIHRRATNSLKLVPFTGDLRKTAVLCSYDWHELDDEPYSAKARRTLAERKIDISHIWTAANEAVARELISRAPVASKLLASIEHIFLDCDRLGLRPNSCGLLNSFARIDAKFARSLVTHLLSKKHSPLHDGWTHLIAGTIRFPDPWLEAKCCKVLDGQSVSLTRSLLYFLSAAVSGSPTPKMLRALRCWAKSARDERASLAVSLIRHGRGPDDPFWHAIAPNLSLSRLTPEQLRTAGESVFAAIKYSDVSAPLNFLLALTAELTRVPDLGFKDGYDFLALMGERAPRAVFDLYRRRILLSEKKRLRSFNAVPMDPHPLKNLPTTKGFPALVRSLFRAVRARGRKERWAWNRLLQCSVIKVSPLAVPELEAWARSATSMDVLEGMSSIFSFEDSLYLLRNPDLTLALLRRGRQLDAAKYPEWEARLASTIGPKIHSFTNGKRDSEQDYVAAEVNKFISIGNIPPELQSFYAAVIKHDQSRIYRGDSREFDDED
jgi:hypothetical protein